MTMNPCGYCVTPSTGSPMLILRQEDAVERAVQRRGACTALFSIEQICAYLEDSNIECDEAVMMLRSFEGNE